MSVVLTLDVDRRTNLALNEQIRQRIIHLINDGALPPGTKMPSSRQLARDLGVSRSVVVEAYQQLTSEGWLLSRNRSGTTVSQHSANEPRTLVTTATAKAPRTRWNLVPGSADVRSFPRREWMSCMNTVIRRMSDRDMDYPPPAGVPSARAALANYLGRVRLVRTNPEQVMMTAGFAQGLTLVCRLLLRRGIDQIGLEDPGHPGQRLYLENLGMRTVAINVDEQGLNVAALARSGVRAVLVTPAHQFPTGVVLTAERRQALVEWAEHVDGWIIEDDYDGEFWYDHSSRPHSLQCLSPERVVYGGTASKSLAPGLRMGWLAAPKTISGELQVVRETFDLGSGTVEQLAYAEFVQSGLQDKHLRRVRESYRQRWNLIREYLIDGHSDKLPEIQLTGVAAGLHAHLRFPEDLCEEEFLHQAELRGIALHGASRFRLKRADSPPGIVLGYAKESGAWLAEALGVLRHLAISLRRTVPRRETRESGRCP
ncbi:MocR-like pyridoxine biosynthesis transcription factor PdxR [Saccharopolyspora phatthalungensis]|uniref:GntR family transcriptional regulator/MocR family aminotransferase n=1 Tax=Saccharopolyspora phatthalungensis TaxID=664693 RepID=A0A840QBQ2_9PSEU|nr:PLP-dependent aminotransferase family protein [Saccharopolyspora phatthalungensis]MBB5157231.1 GntR family transcriptional regulator/MocR family aminotransferase [Saccharopolyspora phatthalungensis]